jgi:hypothetical protein
MRILRLGELNDSQPSAVAHLVSVAIRGIGVRLAGTVLHSGTVSDEMRAQLEDDLAAYDEFAALRQALKEERVVGLANYASFHWVSRLLFSDLQVGPYLDVMDQQIAATSRPLSEISVTPPAVGMAGTVEPALRATHEATTRLVASTRCLADLERSAKTATHRDTVRSEAGRVESSRRSVRRPIRRRYVTIPTRWGRMVNLLDWKEPIGRRGKARRV